MHDCKQYGESPLVQTPLVADHMPVFKHVAVGDPVKPALQLARQVAPETVLALQLNTPFAGLVRFPVHTAASMSQQQRSHPVE